MVVVEFPSLPSRFCTHPLHSHMEGKSCSFWSSLSKSCVKTQQSPHNQLIQYNLLCLWNFSNDQRISNTWSNLILITNIIGSVIRRMRALNLRYTAACLKQCIWRSQMHSITQFFLDINIPCDPIQYSFYHAVRLR